MDKILVYIVWSGLSLILLYGFYYFILRKETCFGCIRLYLLFSLIFSLLIPFVPDWANVQNFIPGNISLTLKPVVINPENVLSGSVRENPFWQLYIWVYLSGLIIGILRLLVQLVHIFVLIQKTGIRRQLDAKVVYTGKPFTNFSFFNIVFLNSSSKEGDEINQIISHEKIHILQKHYLDLLFIELMTIIFWFNPVIWLYKHSLKAVHEYLADEGVLATGYRKESYQKILLNQTFGIQLYALTNNFNRSIIKRRFTMMSKQKRKSQTIVKTLLGVPLMLLIVFVVSCNTGAKDEGIEPSTTKNEEPGPNIIVEEMPVFKGGDKARIKYLVENIKYPEEARKNGVQGRVFVTFVVEEDGKLSDVKILKGIGGGCDEEAVRVIKDMPEWEPGKQKGKAVRVQFNMPIMFKLN
ncbi:MAG: hypothetical protein DRJ05_06685 [Bacteroidetes bacterium]|nr:MAG: hypothetical protein DRJ05_06685 [Bacteroidota bacterium]